MDIKDVAKSLGKTVSYRMRDGVSRYRLNACILRKYNNKFCYFAELLDKNNNSVIIVPLEKVEAV